MTEVKAKKFLGQHFLTDENIAAKIVESLSADSHRVLEIGPGMGVLTKYLIARPDTDFHVVEIDRESVAYLHDHYPTLDVIEGDFLRYDLSTLFHDSFSIIGNFPYNISTYVILSVLLSAFYNIEYLFTVHEHVFNPPPKVKSAVIKLTRNDVKRLECDEKLFVQVVKAGFNQRRKTLRNALRQLNMPIEDIGEEILAKRAEQLSVEQFIDITKTIQSCM